MPKNTPQSLLAATLLSTTAACQPLTGDIPLSDDAPKATGYTTTTLLTGLEHPWAIAWLPNGDQLITERPGTLRLVKQGKLLPNPIATLPVFAKGQGGLMDVAIHPDFQSNNLVYLTYSEGDADANRTVLSRATLKDDALTNNQVIFRVNIDKRGSQHFGSRILFLPDNTLLLAIGDGGNPPVKHNGNFIRDYAQDTTTHNGKVLHLNDDGTPARGANIDDAAPEVYSYGHRNIQGLARNPDTGTIWANEHGANGGDELNIIQPAKNYGWPIATYSREYWGPRISEKTQAEGMIDPLVVWTPCKAPSGLAFYTGDAFPQWKGDLFSGALRGEHIRRIILQGDDVVSQEIIPTNARVRDVRQGPDGHIYYLTDENNGKLIRLDPT